MTKITATRARTNFFDLLNQVNKKHISMHISHKDGDAVLMSEDDYESLIETLELLSIPGFRKSIQKGIKQIAKGDVYTMQEVFPHGK